jgi:hypothetical protein
MKRWASLFMVLSWLAGSIAAHAAEPAPTQGEARPTAAPAPAPAAATPAAAAPRASERVELDTTQITGNRELPRVLYVVPWKRADLGESAGKPAKSLLDEVLSPVDRDVFRRQNRYHEALQPDRAAASEAAGADEPRVER